MKKVTLFIILLIPAFAYAETYQNEAGFMQMVGDYITDTWDFLQTDIPSVIQRFSAWLVIKYTEIKLYAQFEAMKFSWGVAKEILNNYQFASKITTQANALPQDIRQALVDCRFFDALTILLNGALTRYVMRLF